MPAPVGCWCASAKAESGSGGRAGEPMPPVSNKHPTVVLGFREKYHDFSF